MKPNENTTTPFLTATDLRQRWQVSGMFLHRLRRAGRLTAYKIGKRGVRFALSDILKIELPETLPRFAGLPAAAPAGGSRRG